VQVKDGIQFLRRVEAIKRLKPLLKRRSTAEWLKRLEAAGARGPDPFSG
jgi:hypothetical protein